MSSTSGINAVVSEYVPWRKGVSWWVVLLQGIILLTIGVLALWGGLATAANVVLVGLGIYLIIAAIWTIVQAMRGRDYGLSVFNLLAAGGGLVAGIGVLIPFILRGREAIDTFTVQTTSFVTFAVALITVGVLWLLSSFVERPEGGVVIMTLVRGILFLALGGYILFGVATGTANVVRWVSIAATVVGALLIVYSILLNRRQAARTPA